MHFWFRLELYQIHNVIIMYKNQIIHNIQCYMLYIVTTSAIIPLLFPDVLDLCCGTVSVSVS